MIDLIFLCEVKPFVAIRALVSDPSAEGSHEECKSGIFTEVAAKYAVTEVGQFISLLPSPRSRVHNEVFEE